MSSSADRPTVASPVNGWVLAIWESAETLVTFGSAKHSGLLRLMLRGVRLA
jgi:hypothetical protein